LRRFPISCGISPDNAFEEKVLKKKQWEIQLNKMRIHQNELENILTILVN
jgi:hypothetical protein